jgi:hypothetical protein
MGKIFILTAEGILGRDMQPENFTYEKTFTDRTEAEKHVIPFAREIAENFPQQNLEGCKATDEEPLLDFGYTRDGNDFRNNDSEEFGVSIEEIEDPAALTEDKAEDLLFDVQNRANGDNPVTTHQLAKALLALPDTALENEHHTEVWSSSIGSLEAQVAVRTW